MLEDELNFNRVVLEEIAKDIAPGALGKTLIYAVDDKHADLIIKILKEFYSAKGASTEAVLKITGSVGDKRRINDAIRRFKNERYPSIVVTVDLLTTRIDVPQIDKLIFMRRVKSRILFEQMPGRATRLCPEICKTHFEIYDAVGVYESLEQFSEMNPVVVNPAETFKSLLEKLKVAKNATQIQQQINQLLGKLTSGLGSLAAGAYGAVGAFVTASTGVAISDLSGATATNATLTWLGSGFIAAGNGRRIILR